MGWVWPSEERRFDSKRSRGEKECSSTEQFGMGACGTDLVGSQAESLGNADDP